MGTAITLVPPEYRIKMKVLCDRHFRYEYAVSCAFSRGFFSKCQFANSRQSHLILHYRKISWSVRSTLDGNRFDPPPPSGNQRPRLIRALQDLRTKLITKIREIKKNLPVKLFLFFVGFYCATAFSTAIGQTGDWDVLSAAFTVLVVECIGALMYRTTPPLVGKLRNLITVFNYWKAGLSLGLFLDSFKYEADNIFGLCDKFTFDSDIFSMFF